MAQYFASMDSLKSAASGKTHDFEPYREVVGSCRTIAVQEYLPGQSRERARPCSFVAKAARISAAPREHARSGSMGLEHRNSDLSTVAARLRRASQEPVR